MISLRREIDASERFAPRFQALLKAFLRLTSALPKAALPASPDLSEQCQSDLERVTSPLNAEESSVKAIEEAGETAFSRLEEVCNTNKSAFEERDAALKDVVTTIAEAIGSFKGHGEKNNSSLTTLADGFEALSHIDDVNELRRRLHENAAKLRECAEEMRRENEQAVLRFQTQVNTFQQRLDAARKDSSLDRLTGLASRREAERYLQKLPQQDGPLTLLLFSIERFQDINDRNGPIFADKLLRAFAHLLLEQYSEEDHAYRWGPHEFLAVIQGSLATCTERGRHICQTFAESKYYTAEAGPGVPLRAIVALGAVQHAKGQSADDSLRRVKEALEKDRKAVWK